MSQKIRNSFLLLLLLCVSCLKEPTETITIEGTVQDEFSQQPISNIYIIIDGIKSSTSGFGGIIDNGERKNVGNVTTDVNGHYKIKLKVFKGADRLNFYLNPENIKKDYSDNQDDLYLSNIKSNGNLINFKLSPTSQLKISFKNVKPVSDTDFFYFRYFNFTGKGIAGDKVEEENCGSIKHSEAITWTGKDVCGSFTVPILGDRFTYISWLVKKNGVTNQYSDSVFVKRNIVGQFSINY